MAPAASVSEAVPEEALRGITVSLMRTTRHNCSAALCSTHTFACENLHISQKPMDCTQELTSSPAPDNTSGSRKMLRANHRPRACACSEGT